LILVDILGREIDLFKSKMDWGFEYSINTAHFARGQYFLRIITDDMVLIKSVGIQVIPSTPFLVAFHHRFAPEPCKRRWPHFSTQLYFARHSVFLCKPFSQKDRKPKLPHFPNRYFDFEQKSEF
jgi:hypothetical protein